MSLLLVNSLQELQEFVNKPNSGVILMVSTTFCPPCKRITPIFEEVANMFSGKFVALKTNLDESPDINGWLGVGSVPTFIFWKDGKEIYRVIGGCTRDTFIKHVNNFFDQ